LEKKPYWTALCLVQLSSHNFFNVVPETVWTFLLSQQFTYSVAEKVDEIRVPAGKKADKLNRTTIKFYAAVRPDESF
jgi:hypothetical protein